MVFVRGKSGNPSGVSKDGRPRKRKGDDVQDIARRAAPEAIEQLKKMMIGTAVPWKVRYEAAIAILALGGNPLPRPPAQLQHSGPDGKPLPAGGHNGVFIYQSLEHAQKAAAAAIDAGAETVAFLPSNGFEVTNSPEPPDPDDELDPPITPQLAERVEEVVPATGQLTAEAEPSDEELIRIVREAGYEVSK